MCTRGLLDIYTLSPRVYIYIRQTTCAHGITIKYDYLYKSPYIHVSIFWRYIKSLCRDNTGVASLKHGNSLMTVPHDKAKILNDQLFSVFTHENLSDLSQCTNPALPLAPDIAFSTDGILKLITINH